MSLYKAYKPGSEVVQVESEIIGVENWENDCAAEEL